jgi:solute carrier family 24 (sodium/potassium/calcium exchanger), member 6
LQAPVVLCLKLIIPVVDYGEDLHGWSKLLNMLHILVLPQLLLAVTGHIKIVFVDYIPLSLIALLASLALSIIVFCSSRNDCPPSYHMTFAAGSFVGSICVIYTTAKEVVCVMKVLGIISDMTDSMVGLLFLAIGNSIGDLFSNISLARQGYQQMAIAACFGGPMFSEEMNVDCLSTRAEMIFRFQIRCSVWARLSS